MMKQWKELWKDLKMGATENRTELVGTAVIVTIAILLMIAICILSCSPRTQLKKQAKHSYYSVGNTSKNA